MSPLARDNLHTYLVDSRGTDTENIAYKSVGTSVLDPIIVRINGSSELSRGFTIGNILGGSIGWTGGKGGGCHRVDI